MSHQGGDPPLPFAQRFMMHNRVDSDEYDYKEEYKRTMTIDTRRNASTPNGKLSRVETSQRVN
jgi:hypothetical protein